MILQLLSNWDWTWVGTALIAGLVYAFANLYLKRQTLPPGPPPLPVIGNALAFLGKTHVDQKVSNWRAKYGDVFTLWVGPKPTVIVCGWDRMKEGLLTRKNDFSGRVVRFSGEVFLDGHKDVIFADYSPEWETLRKLVSLAVRKYSVSESLAILVDDVVKKVAPLMLEEKGAFDPSDYLYLTIYNVLASTAFGKRYEMDDEEFVHLKNANDKLNHELGFGTILDIFPSLQIFFRKMASKIRFLVKEFQTPIAKQYKLHQETYTKGVIRDFTDACLSAKEEAEREDKGTAQYFNDRNMVLVLFDLFSAGTDTTRITLSWILLYLSQNPEIQEKVRAEVKENIGDRMPTQEDKHKCPYTTAVITETLRIRPVISFTLEHKATRDTEFAGYKIPNQTSIVFHIISQQHDGTCWKEPEAFRPERFLDEDGKFMTTSRFNGYLPFGLGRRACPGEKMALADLFLILTGFLQKCRFSLPDGPGSADTESQRMFMINLPKPYKLKVEKV